MVQVTKIGMVAGLALFLGGCAQTGVNNQQAGTVLGGALGGIAGNQIGGGSGKVVATIAGTMLGAAIGGNIGRSMDEVDRMRMSRALESRPTGQSSSWRNPDSGAAYSVTPTRTYERNAQPCREYTMQAVIDGRTETVRGTACRQADGTWVQQ